MYGSTVLSTLAVHSIVSAPGLPFDRPTIYAEADTIRHLLINELKISDPDGTRLSYVVRCMSILRELCTRPECYHWSDQGATCCLCSGSFTIPMITPAIGRVDFQRCEYM